EVVEPTSNKELSKDAVKEVVEPASNKELSKDAAMVPLNLINKNENIKQNVNENYTSVPVYAQIKQDNNGNVLIKLYDINKQPFPNSTVINVSGGKFNNNTFDIKNGQFEIPNNLLGWPQTVTITVTEDKKNPSPIYVVSLPANENNYSQEKTASIGDIKVIPNNGRSLILHPTKTNGEEYDVGSAVFSDGVLLGYLNKDHKVRITEYTLPVGDTTEITIQNLSNTADNKIYRVSDPKTLNLSQYHFNKKTFNVELKSNDQSVRIIDTNGAVYYNRIWLPTTKVTIGDQTFSYVNNDGSGVSSFLSLFDSEGKLKNFTNVQYDGYDFTDDGLIQYWNSELDSQSFNFIISESFIDGQLEYTVGLENTSPQPISDITLGFDLDISYKGKNVPVYKGNDDTLYVKGENNPYGLYISKG
ncbi:hypothetical protein, partial [Enterococcus faecium]|uniref:hypothetical protein n=1 Tax=Enterococcus faecium TaxID=1352 RepID=UPI0015C5E2CB